ncbi:MAG: plasmid mobilization relaxosome protein MobC [Oscillospiraceae bacterium]|nr:plasmid mobilization relaxosome protein MobC [Oscillospiraceae bacterium]
MYEKKKVNYTEARKKAYRHIEKKVLLADEELEAIKRNAECVGMKVGTYMRVIAIKGEIKRFDMRAVNDVRLELHRIGVNINQIAHLVNETQSVNPSDMQRLETEMKKMKKIMDNWLSPFE